jgi:DnaJ-class molecular chaperone
MKYELCSNCHGSGMVQRMDGVADCPECGGACEVPARDERGRFMKDAPAHPKGAEE